MTKTLRLNFYGDDGKAKSLTLTSAKDGLGEAEVRSAMGKISTSAIFEKEGVALYAKPRSASYIERTVTNIFDDSEDAGTKKD